MSCIAPFLRTAILCQRVKFDAQTRPHVTLFEPLHTITLPADRFDRPLSEMERFDLPGKPIPTEPTPSRLLRLITPREPLQPSRVLY